VSTASTAISPGDDGLFHLLQRYAFARLDQTKYCLDCGFLAPQHNPVAFVEEPDPIAGLDAQLLPQFDGDGDLSLGGDGRGKDGALR